MFLKRCTIGDRKAISLILDYKIEKRKRMGRNYEPKKKRKMQISIIVRNTEREK